MKKIIALFVVASVCLAAAGCQGGADPADQAKVGVSSDTKGLKKSMVPPGASNGGTTTDSSATPAGGAAPAPAAGGTPAPTSG